jgi:hypothetical protein
MGRNGIIVEMTTDETEVVERDLNRRDRGNHFKKFSEEDEEVSIKLNLVAYILELIIYTKL